MSRHSFSRTGTVAVGSHSRGHARHEVRIIGGQWRRRLLPVLAEEGLRPTSDRVRETLFNWLGQSLDGLRCLDMFAGSGALGFEAASRGAAYVLMLERNGRVVKQLRENQARLEANQIAIVHTDALAYAAQLPAGTFDIIFLDPPFAQNLLMLALDRALPLLQPAGLLYVETGQPLDEAGLPPSYQVLRASRAGAVYYHLLACKSS